MPIGTGTFIPQGQFWVTRSYVTQFIYSDILDHLSQSGNHLTFIPTLDPTHIYHLDILLEFYVWSTNNYSLDHIVTDYYYTDLTGNFLGTPTFTLSYGVPLSFLKPSIIFRPSGVITTDAKIDLLPRSSPYWLPDL
jgi:hypothetical protein